MFHGKNINKDITNSILSINHPDQIPIITFLTIRQLWSEKIGK